MKTEEKMHTLVRFQLKFGGAVGLAHSSCTDEPDEEDDPNRERNECPRCGGFTDLGGFLCSECEEGLLIMKCRVSVEELQHDEMNMKMEIAEEMALKAINTGDFDSDTVMSALKNQNAEWWDYLTEQIQNDTCAAGLRLRLAVYDQLVKDFLEDS